MNPALPGGAPGDVGASANGGWQVAGRLSYTGIPYSRLQQGTDRAANPNELEVNVHLATTQLDVAAPTGTRASFQLPAGRLSTSTVDEGRADTDIGDAEVRVWQRLPWFNVPRIEIGVGLALPTGPYVERSGAANLPPEASFLTLGRGVTWAIAEVLGTMPMTERLSGYMQVNARVPLGQTKDDFEWGSEARAALGGRATLPYGISALAIAELQWRGGASEPDPFADGRLDSANAGGTWWTLTPALGYQINRELSVLGGLRIPVRSDVRGNQLVPSLGAFVTLSASWTRTPPSSPVTPAQVSTITPKPKPGVVTVIDYWATWCAPCKSIDERLSEAKPSWSGVEVIKVDASAWPDAGPALPEGAKGLPVIEIFDRTGKRVRLLTGKEALNVVTIVNNIRSSLKDSP